MGYTKVFTGNLSFKTKEDQLAEQFAAAGKVVSANIITRGPRSLGYGFVEFETEQEALSAVELLNKKNIDGRDINVELAKPREEKQPQQADQQNNDQPTRRRGGFRGGRRGGRGGYQGQANNNNNGQESNQAANSPSQGQPQSGEPAPRHRQRRNPRNINREGQQASPAQGQQQDQQEGDASAPQNGDGQYIARGRGGRGGGGRGRGRGGRGGGRGRGGRRTYNRPPRPQTVESTTSLFVANLPFDLDDAKLLELFKEHKAIKAHVVTNFQGRSRGFGFVDFDENDQKQAFDTTNQNQIVVSNRPLTVKIALVEAKPSAEEAASETAAAAPAPTPTTPTPAQN